MYGNFKSITHQLIAAPQMSSYTPQQREAVVRVMKLKVTDYYGHLLVEKTVTTVELKRAYRKQALIMHPDKNKAPQADEAFKRISKAYEVLSDETKRKIFDQTGEDPDSRGGMGRGFGGGGNSFNQKFNGSPFARGGGSPFGAQFGAGDDIFQQFFGGGGGSQFQFSYGNGSDMFSNLFEEMLFGSARGRNHAQQQQQQARERASRAGEDPQSDRFSSWFSLGIIVLVLVLPTIVSNLFGSGSNSRLPEFRFNPRSPYTVERRTPKYHVPYYVKQKDVSSLSDAKLRTLDTQAENRYVQVTRAECSREHMQRQEAMQDAVGWFYTDTERYEEAKYMVLPHCEILETLGLAFR